MPVATKWLLRFFNLKRIEREQQVPSRWPFLVQKLKSVSFTELRISELICTIVGHAVPVSC